MQSVECPFCGGKMYSASWKAGKVRCLYCKGAFFVGYDEIRHLWLATDPESPIQAVMIRKAKENEAK